MPSSKKKTTDFLAMWCNEGLECLFNLTEFKKDHDNWEKSVIWDTLKESKMRDIEPTIPLKMMILRAQFNQHREYEIYTFTASRGVDEKEVRTLFNTNPQFIVDFIRKNGSKVISHKEKNRRVIE